MVSVTLPTCFSIIVAPLATAYGETDLDFGLS
jgi:hypothetical protein